MAGVIRTCVQTAAGDLQATLRSLASGKNHLDRADDGALDPSPVLAETMLQSLLVGRSGRGIGLAMASDVDDAEAVFALADAHGLDGPVRHLTGDAGGAAAFLVAASWIADGACTHAVVLGVQRRSPTRDRAGPQRGEGAGAVLLGRTSPIARWIAGTGLASEGDVGGSTLRASLDALRQAGVGPGDVAVVWPAESGALDAEARALWTLFPDPRPTPRTRPTLGHLGPAAGVVDTVCAIATLPDDRAALVLAGDGALRSAVVVSAAPGGLDLLPG